MQFEWDPKKAEHNLGKHGVDFIEASSVFYDPLSVTYPDPIHSMGEERYIIIGLSVNNRLLIVSHVDREDNIRIISARVTTRNERKLYES
ncbi:BrnT family toxin [candidate division KSB1 bacterium]|nr:MAG: BrnT family toxin [candidate division KSB1 bacterium]